MARSFAISTVPGPINPQLSDTVIPTNYQPPVVEANSFPELDLTKIYSTLQKLNPLIRTAGTKKKKNKKIKRTKSRSGIKQSSLVEEGLEEDETEPEPSTKSEGQGDDITGKEYASLQRRPDSPISTYEGSFIVSGSDEENS